MSHKSWFDRFKPKDKTKPTIPNPLAGLFRGSTSSFHGAGQSLGGSRPGTVISVELSKPGSLGLKVEKRANSQGTAIVASVVPDGQAASAGLERGDILCYTGSNGEEEIMYDIFIELAKSGQRPICFEVRRVATKATSSNTSDGSADAYARKQAVVAAAEAREKALKLKQKPIKRGLSTEERARQEEIRRQQEAALPDNEPKSEASRQALEAAKQAEAATVAKLGYNPYETNSVTAGQARVASVISSVGAIGSGTTSDGRSKSPNDNTQPTISPPDNALSPVQDDEAPYEQAYEKFITSNDHTSVVAAIGILRTLIINATTKGQMANDEASTKFRRVRLANEKIKAAVVDLDGALDVLLSTGFELVEEEDGRVLIYPYGYTGPDWLSMALTQMQQYAMS